MEYNMKPIRQAELDHYKDQIDSKFRSKASAIDSEIQSLINPPPLTKMPWTWRCNNTKTRTIQQMKIKTTPYLNQSRHPSSISTPSWHNDLNTYGHLRN